MQGSGTHLAQDEDSSVDLEVHYASAMPSCHAMHLCAYRTSHCYLSMIPSQFLPAPTARDGVRCPHCGDHAGTVARVCRGIIERMYGCMASAARVLMASHISHDMQPNRDVLCPAMQARDSIL